jgi:glycerol-3-phosphate dehydrogenase
MTMSHLFKLYGAKAPDVLALTDDAPDLLEPVAPNYPDIRAQLVYAVQSEMAHTYTDILRRRTALAMRVNYGLSLMPVLEKVLMQHCDWTQEQCDRNAADYRIFIEDNCLPDYALQAAARELETSTS